MVWHASEERFGISTVKVRSCAYSLVIQLPHTVLLFNCHIPYFQQINIKTNGAVRTVDVNHNYFDTLYGFTATCFGSYTNSPHQADKVPKKNYVNQLIL